MSIDVIQTLLGKGPALTANDVREIEVQLAFMPADKAHEASPWIWEGVALIVNDPDYQGDAKVPA